MPSEAEKSDCQKSALDLMTSKPQDIYSKGHLDPGTREEMEKNVRSIFAGLCYSRDWCCVYYSYHYLCSCT